MNFDNIDPRTVSVIYHADCNDGFGAVYAAWKRFGDAAQYFPCKYGKLPEDRWFVDKHVFVVDFSFPRDVLEHMKDAARSLVVLDHHKTAEEDLRGLPYAIFDMNRSGALMTWQYFHGSHVPRLIQHLSDYDLWQFTMQDTRPFIHRLNCYPKQFRVWDDISSMIERTVTDYIQFRDEGKIVETRHNMIVADIAKGAAPITFFMDDPKTPTLNRKKTATRVCGMGVNCSPVFSSDVGHLLAQKSKGLGERPFGVCWHYDANSKMIIVSLRSIGGFDTTLISRHYGGGGHEPASGFRMNPDDFFSDRF